MLLTNPSNKSGKGFLLTISLRSHIHRRIIIQATVAALIMVVEVEAITRVDIQEEVGIAANISVEAAVEQDMTTDSNIIE